LLEGYWSKYDGSVEGRSCRNHVIFQKKIPLAYFDVMTHLVVHIVEELDMCDLVHTRWMCPMVRYMRALKGYIRNQGWLEGSMATRYAIEKALGFCLEYIQEVKSKKRRVWDDKEELTMHDEYTWRLWAPS